VKLRQIGTRILDVERLTVVEFTGKWCGPCNSKITFFEIAYLIGSLGRAMGPILDAMSLKYPQV